MCRFKSGIILKSRSYVAEGADESHTNLLEKLNIEDTIENAARKFVRVELIPNKNEWWTHPNTWKINIDQDILPDWFEEDKEKYLKEFRERVIEWWNNHVFIDKTIDTLENGYYRLKNCEVGALRGNVNVVLKGSTVKVMRDKSIVEKMYDHSTVEIMRDYSTVEKMYDHSTVEIMRDYSTVKIMCNSSIVEIMCNSSIVEIMCNSSIVEIMCNSSIVKEMYDSSIIIKDLEGNIVVSSENAAILKRHENK